MNPQYLYSSTVPPIRVVVHEVGFEINGYRVYVKVTDPNNELSNRQIKSKAWSYLKKISNVEVRRNV